MIREMIELHMSSREQMNRIQGEVKCVLTVRNMEGQDGMLDSTMFWPEVQCQITCLAFLHFL